MNYCQLILLAVMAIGILAQKFSWLPFPQGFLVFMFALASIVVLALVAIIFLALSISTRRAAWRIPASISVGGGLVPLGIIVVVLGAGLSAPAIHDISTDLENPPQFSEALTERNATNNSLEHDKAVAELQKQHYPEIQSLELPQTPDQVFESVLALVRRYGWTTLREDSNRHEIEAVEESVVFGFKDDVIIRISAENTGSRIDIRSASRVGQSDLGANAKRIKLLLSELSARPSE